MVTSPDRATFLPILGIDILELSIIPFKLAGVSPRGIRPKKPARSYVASEGDVISVAVAPPFHRG